MLNQKRFIFVPILIGLFVVITGVAVVSEATGHYISLSSSPTTEQPNSPLSSQGQIQVQALPTNSPTSSNYDYEAAKAAGLTDEEIQAYLASKSPNGTVTIKDKTTGEVKKIPKSQLGNYISKNQTQPTDKALQLATYIFGVGNETQRNELINKFSNGKNDLKLAITNLALMLDSKPEALALAEKLVSEDLAKKKSQAKSEAMLESQKKENEAIFESHKKEYERLKAELDNIPTNISNTYIGEIQNNNTTSLISGLIQLDVLSACLNNVAETINNAPIVAGSKLNYSPSQIQAMKDACNH